MIVRLSIAMVLVLSMAACSTYQREFDANPPFGAHYYRNFDVEVSWQAERTGQNLRLSGTVTNQRNAYLRDMELTVRILDEKGKILAKETIDDFPTYMPYEKSSPFQLRLTLLEGATPARLRYNYTYFLTEEPPAVRGYGGYDDIPHFGRFDAPL